ncbi:leucine-rich repeat domain-containing protein [Halovulum sp. GXIMD14793]
MVDDSNAEPIVVSIEEPLSVAKLRQLNPHKPIDAFYASGGGVFDVKWAQVLSSWPSIRSIRVYNIVTRAAFRQLLSVPGLEEINVSGFHDHGSLKGMLLPSSFRNLRASGLKTDDLVHIADLPSLNTLSAQHSSFSQRALRKLASHSELKSLDLKWGGLDDEKAATLAKSKSITDLCVCANRVGRQGLKSICEMRQLRELDIWALDITENDLDLLQALPDLEYLSVGGYDEQTVLTAKGVLPRIAQLPSLKKLWLDGIPLSKAEVAQLEEQYEHVQVTTRD